jgi:ubiquinone/menaquinone biosynthesis C-methylase UbiE
LPILDAGCGTGQTAVHLKQLSFPVTALEPDRTMAHKAALRFQQNGLSIPIVHEKLEQTSFEAGSFSYILSESVLSFTDISKSASEIQRILKPNGMLIAVEATRLSGLSSIETNEIKHFYGFNELHSAEEWIAIMKRTGFSHVNVVNDADLHVYEKQEAEMDLSPSIPEQTYTILDQHYQLLKKYQGRLGHLIFTALKK